MAFIKEVTSSKCFSKFTSVTEGKSNTFFNLLSFEFLYVSFRNEWNLCENIQYDILTRGNHPWIWMDILGWGKLQIGATLYTKPSVKLEHVGFLLRLDLIRPPTLVSLVNLFCWMTKWFIYKQSQNVVSQVLRIYIFFFIVPCITYCFYLPKSI